MKRTSIIHGNLLGWFETGLGGTVWALQKKGTTSHKGLYVLEKGDKLTILKATHKEIAKEMKCKQYISRFTGKMIKDFVPGSLCTITIEPDYKIGIPEGETQQVANGLWVLWIQKGWEPNSWGLLFSCELSAILERKL